MYFKPVASTFSTILAAFVDGRRHRHGAHHVFARVERSQGHPGVVWNRAVEMHEVDARVGEHVMIVHGCNAS